MREKHATTTLTINVLNSILDHKDLIDRFLKATENNPCPEEIEKEMKAAGIAPDRSFIQSALNQYGKKFSLKAARYIELDKRKRNTAEKAEFRKLAKKLAAKGLDPKHCGLAERAAILDNGRVIKNFLDETERNGFASESLIKALKKLGIRPERGHIIRVQREIVQNAKAADRLKRTKTTRAPHKTPATDEEVYDADDEYDEEDDVYAVPAEAAAF